MFKIVIGDLFETDAEAICHGVNCEGEMNSGIAVEFKKRWPDMFDMYQGYCRMDRDLNAGGLYVYKTDPRKTVSSLAEAVEKFQNPPVFNPKYIFNMFTQIKQGPHADYDLVRKSAQSVRRYAEHHKISKIALPAIGAGVGGLNLEAVVGILRQEWADSEVSFEMVLLKTSDNLWMALMDGEKEEGEGPSSGEWAFPMKVSELRENLSGDPEKDARLVKAWLKHEGHVRLSRKAMENLFISVHETTPNFYHGYGMVKSQNHAVQLYTSNIDPDTLGYWLGVWAFHGNDGTFSTIDRESSEMRDSRDRYAAIFRRNFFFPVEWVKECVGERKSPPEILEQSNGGDLSDLYVVMRDLGEA